MKFDKEYRVENQTKTSSDYQLHKVQYMQGI